MKKIIFFLSIFFITKVYAIEQVPNGLWLLNQCQAYTAAKEGYGTKYIDGAVCIGFLIAVDDANFNNKRDSLSYCAPNGTYTENDILVVLHYLNNHPEKLSFSAFYLSRLALHEAWPCK